MIIYLYNYIDYKTNTNILPEIVGIFLKMQMLSDVQPICNITILLKTFLSAIS